MKIYVIENSFCSNKYVYGVTDDEDQAKEMVEKLGEYASYKKFDTDKISLQTGHIKNIYWDACIEYTDGTLTQELFQYKENFDEEKEKMRMNDIQSYLFNKIGKIFDCVCRISITKRICY